MAAKKEQMEKNKEKLKQLNEFIEEKSPVTGEEESKGGRRNVAERRDSSGKYEHRESRSVYFIYIVMVVMIIEDIEDIEDMMICPPA